MRLSRALPAAAALVIAGCESSPTAPVPNVDEVLTQMSSGGIATYAQAATSASSGGMGTTTSPSLPSTGSSSCQYDAATRFFVCAPVTSNGVTFSRAFQLLDPSGAPLSAPNPLALAAVRSVVDIDGTVTPPAGSPLMATQITRHEDATLSGLQSGARLLNGSATQRLAMTGSSFGFESNDTSTTTNLQLPSTSAQHYPLGGKIVTNRTVTTSGVVVSSFHQQEEITFDGTSVMTVKITQGTTVRTCRIDLAAPGGAPTCS